MTHDPDRRTALFGLGLAATATGAWDHARSRGQRIGGMDGARCSDAEGAAFQAGRRTAPARFQDRTDDPRKPGHVGS